MMNTELSDGMYHASQLRFVNQNLFKQVNLVTRVR